MGVAGITRAVLLAVNTAPAKATYDAVYGGEPLLTRALVALSKAGIRSVRIICHEGDREKIAGLIGKARTRLALDYDICPIRTGETLSKAVSRLAERWDTSFLLFETNKVVHPTFFAQVAQFAASPKPVLVVYKHVWLNGGKVAFESTFLDKFKLIFANPESLTKIALDNSVFQSNFFQSNAFDVGPARPVEISSTLSNGIFSTDVVVCHRSHLGHLTFSSFADLIRQWNQQQLLRLGFVENVWWLQVTGEEPQAYLREFFWRIGFKEISGEFSKLVNSHLSKPLTFLFVRFGFSPNAISILELSLFLVSSAFLLIPQYWAMLVFAVVWQFSAGVLDRCDGEVARIRNYESEAGARFDMLIDDLRFALPFVFLTIACYRESHRDLYLVVALATAAWYSTAVVYHNRFLRRAGYVSIQTMGVDFLKTQAETRWFAVFRRIQPFTKGDIRTFYIFLASFLGNKSVLFWMLVAYAWPLGASYFFTIFKFRHPSASAPASIA
jgi:phosphatidylglycerophosphate synthase